jgi:Tfp pilus assembly protein PilX
MRKTQKANNQRGQALVVLLFYMIIAITVTTTAIALAISNSISALKEEEGNHALEIAESGAENALLRLLRDNTYSGETVAIGNGSAQISITNGSTKTVTSVGTEGDFKRTIRVVAVITNGLLSIQSWSEM